MKMDLKMLKKPIAKFVKDAVHKKTGCKADVHVNKVFGVIGGGTPKVHLSIDIGLDKSEFTKILGLIH